MPTLQANPDDVCQLIQHARDFHAQDNEPEKNRILCSMDPVDLACIRPYLSLVDWDRGQVIHETGIPQTFVYFPLDALASIMLSLEDGHSCEISIVGNDGLLGMSILTHSETALTYSVTQVAGSAYRIKASILREMVRRSENLRALLLRYTQVLVTQIGQTATCNRFHNIQQQLARWLLTATDHLPNSQLQLTQDQIAHSLGVRREGVTEAACRLQKAGLIDYRRGRINVIDRHGLERACCECYQSVKYETNRLLPE